MKIIKVNNKRFNFKDVENKYIIYNIYDEVMIIRSVNLYGINYFFVKSNTLFLHIIDEEMYSTFYVNKDTKEIFLINNVSNKEYKGILIKFNSNGFECNDSVINTYEFMRKYKNKNHYIICY